MDIYVKISQISIFYLFWFKSWFCQIHWFYTCRSFKHNWWRHEL